MDVGFNSCSGGFVTSLCPLTAPVLLYKYYAIVFNESMKHKRSEPQHNTLAPSATNNVDLIWHSCRRTYNVETLTSFTKEKENHHTAIRPDPINDGR